MEPQYASAQRMYDARAPKYDNSWHPWFAKHIATFTAMQPGHKVLDLACGTGLVTFPAAEAVGPEGHVVGVDVSSGMLEQAKTKLATVPSCVANIEFYEHDITRLDTLDALKGQLFDAITVASALVLLDDPWTAVRHWTSFLRPGGVLVTDVPSPDTFVIGMTLERTARRLGVQIPYYRDWVKSSDSFRELLESAGLVVEKLEGVEQTGKGVEYLRVSDADELFDGEMRGEHAKALAAVEQQARPVFREEFEKLAVDEVVKSVDLVWVARARKPEVVV